MTAHESQSSTSSLDDLVLDADDSVPLTKSSANGNYKTEKVTRNGVSGSPCLDSDRSASPDLEDYEYDPVLGAQVKRVNTGNKHGRTIYNPDTGAYDEMLDYTINGVDHHHRERVSADGVYQLRDVETDKDGTKHIHKEYNDPITGTSTSVRGCMSDRAFQSDF
ncbi:hypothetical protein BDV25DRAFT_139641 [Aspergillus avenaceus]|uniref:Uncharacterized protein n=1 Tax=Aspergillus avenaceus TaxID=36643 RepID=A0A5N6TW77_ASPAV|nr:hypothetical protein BDV25DRAFT_139641 [Aspergillus avenaceus]